MKALNERSKLHHDATHNCWAMRVGDPATPIEKYSDAGEPSGTAGRPILDQLCKAKLVGAILVVSRWFGGTKLGKGGLVRAYGRCAAETINLLHIIEKTPTVRMLIICGYDLIGSVEALTSRFEGKVVNGAYDVDAHLTAEIPVLNVKDFKRRLQEASGGRLSIIDVNG